MLKYFLIKENKVSDGIIEKYTSNSGLRHCSEEDIKKEIKLLNSKIDNSITYFVTFFSYEEFILNGKIKTSIILNDIDFQKDKFLSILSKEFILETQNIFNTNKFIDVLFKDYFLSHAIFKNLKLLDYHFMSKSYDDFIEKNLKNFF